MPDLIQPVNDALLMPAGISLTGLDDILTTLKSNALDFGDIYVQSTQYESWSLEGGCVKEGSFNLAQGVGVRAIQGEKTGLAYTESLTLPAIREAAMAAKTIAANNQPAALFVAPSRAVPDLYQPVNPLAAFQDKDKVALLLEMEQRARSLDPRVKEVMVTLKGSYSLIYVLGTDGTMAADIRPLVRFHIVTIAEQNGRREQGFSGGGGRFSYAELLESGLPTQAVEKSVRQALTNLDAVAAPAGVMPVVLGPGWAGVLLHEAVGHGLEGDSNRKGNSIFSGRQGEKIASDLCTVVDDGAMPGARGSLQIDDEGTPTQCTVLIENGVLKGYMQDKLNAHLMGVQSTGNGRRESYACQPIPRMTNTYLLAGETPPQEIIASVKKGIYAADFGGGQVDTASGKFVFAATEAYLIENGKITAPIKGATLIGQGSDVLKHVSMVGNDLAQEPGVGTCGKDGQCVPVNVGQPTLLLDKLTVGGTAT
jgi:TldD protein